MEDRLVKLDKYREVGKNREVDKDRDMGIPRPMVHMDRAETSHDYNQDDDNYA